MPRRINISEARARLPELARYVIDSPERVVMIEHRDLADTLVLTTESHLDYLHTVIRELRKQNGSEFRLAGSIQSDLSAEELEAELDAMRREQRRTDEERLRSFGE
jgi:hypothetical protein